MNDEIFLTSFGFGHGTPPPAEHIFDLRDALHNPHHDPAMRTKTGLDPDVRAHVLSTPGALAFGELMIRVVTDEDALTVAIGGVGGRHRSVALAQHVAERLASLNYEVQVVHRDVDKPLLPSRAHQAGMNCAADASGARDGL